MQQCWSIDNITAETHGAWRQQVPSWIIDKIAAETHGSTESQPAIVAASAAAVAANAGAAADVRN